MKFWIPVGDPELPDWYEFDTEKNEVIGIVQRRDGVGEALELPWEPQTPDSSPELRYNFEIRTNHTAYMEKPPSLQEVMKNWWRIRKSMKEVDRLEKAKTGGVVK
jgi:hypothetical protein